VNFSIATSESWKDKQTGERREKTEWHRIVVFSDGLAGVAEKFLKKGALVYIEGTLQTRKWSGSDGVEKYTTEIILQGYNATLTMLDSNGGSGNDQKEG
ncbi:MAG: single-stranded DNA-binding protein, partial [Aestuariibacter sp.]|nr:single-stranded DNA-binding protein [Aestuariibacter sp.]